MFKIEGDTIHKEARMYIFKMILSIFSAILLCKAITENN